MYVFLIPMLQTEAYLCFFFRAIIEGLGAHTCYPTPHNLTLHAYLCPPVVPHLLTPRAGIFHSPKSLNVHHWALVWRHLFTRRWKC